MKQFSKYDSSKEQIIFLKQTNLHETNNNNNNNNNNNDIYKLIILTWNLQI
jgi:hypothetical protein